MKKKIPVLFVLFVVTISIFALIISIPSSVAATARQSLEDGAGQDIAVYIRGRIPAYTPNTIATASFSDGTTIKFFVRAGATWAGIEPLPGTLTDSYGNLINSDTSSGGGDGFGSGEYIPEGPEGGTGDGFDFAPGVPIVIGGLSCRSIMDIPGEVIVICQTV